ncbi:MAG: Re/Si-specific NAD(P)(+) transhydrogenase subunit alpha [Desulfobacterales bacterium]
MKIGILKEIAAGEKRVALIPAMIKSMAAHATDILVEKNAGLSAGFEDQTYIDAGAQILDAAGPVFDQADVILKVQPLQIGAAGESGDELAMMREGSTVIGFLSPFAHLDVIEAMAAKKITAFSMDLVPRITRAQSMDALSAMATVAGYKAVLLAANHLGKFFPLLMTAAGTIPPANVLVLGAGVAGLQAIATAKRLGAKVEAFDPRPVVKEQVESLGAQFVPMPLPEDAETAGGYAKQQSDDFLRQEQQVIGERLPKTDIVITTAQIFGKPAPLLLTEEYVRGMRPGSVIVDMATEQGGNCALTRLGEVVEAHGVTIVGTLNLPSLLAAHASQMYAKTITTLFNHLYQSATFDFEDDITAGTCVLCNGQIKHPIVQDAINAKGNTND